MFIQCLLCLFFFNFLFFTLVVLRDSFRYCLLLLCLFHLCRLCCIFFSCIRDWADFCWIYILFFFLFGFIICTLWRLFNNCLIYFCCFLRSPTLVCMLLFFLFFLSVLFLLGILLYYLIFLLFWLYYWLYYWWRIIFNFWILSLLFEILLNCCIMRIAFIPFFALFVICNIFTLYLSLFCWLFGRC